MKTVMDWKRNVGKGWHSIIEEAIEKIESHSGFVLQVKEKFAGLRIYTHGGDMEAIDDVVRAAESRAALSCEYCGELGSIRTIGFVIKTLCPKCYTDHVAKR